MSLGSNVSLWSPSLHLSIAFTPVCDVKGPCIQVYNIEVE